MTLTTEATPVYDGEASRLTRNAPPLDARDLRYLRKAIRYRLDLRGTPPSRYITGGYLRVGRAAELDRLADWIVQAGS